MSSVFLGPSNGAKFLPVSPLPELLTIVRCSRSVGRVSKCRVDLFFADNLQWVSRTISFDAGITVSVGLQLHRSAAIHAGNDVQEKGTIALTTALGHAVIIHKVN